MMVYRVDKNGFMESFNTVGNYKAPGWYSTPEKARKHKYAEYRRWQEILNHTDTKKWIP